MNGYNSVATAYRAVQIRELFAPVSNRFDSFLQDQVSVSIRTLEDWPEFESLYQAAFGVPINHPQSSIRESYYQELGCALEIKYGPESVGFIILTIQDWQTIYVRSVGIIPEYQGRGIYRMLLGQLIEIYQEADIGITIDVNPSNQKHIKILNGLNFRINGITLDDRWGALISFRR